VREELLIRMTSDAIRPDDALGFVADPSSGATCAFLGTARDRSDSGSGVIGLTYEAWEELARRRLEEIAEEMFAKWPVRRVALLHRTGELEIGEVSVVVACSSPHRSDAFEACRHGIERLKEDVPIWKKERFVSGESRWVMGS
jgi:molybdopterin synthase catalytic subunit